MIEILLYLALCFAITVLLESIPILFLREKKAWWKASLICNVITNPTLNLIILLLTWLLWRQNWDTLRFALEMTVVFLEAFFYHRMLGKGFVRCFLLSLIANAISFVIGKELIAFAF